MQLKLLALWATAAAAASITKTSQACQELLSKYPGSVYLPNDANYTTQRLVVWSMTCISTPYCVFEPPTAKALADGLKVIVKSKTKFSVRSQGHMPVPLANGINDGVFISMSQFNTNKLVDNNKLVQVGPGQTWANVYDFVSPYGLGVAGGRFSPVGVGGLLLGGGINYFGSQVGWSFSTVVNYEVVLANSTIVYANKTSNADLFWALKGGGNNFGIVTRFDMQTIPARKIYGGTTFYAPADCNHLLDAVTAYTLPGGGSYDKRTAILPNINLDPATNSALCSLVAFYDYDDGQSMSGPPAALANFSAIPAAVNGNGLSVSFANYTDQTNTPAYASRASRWLFATTAIKISDRSVPLLNKTFTDSVLAQMTKLKNTTGTSSSLAMQPITTSWLQAARDAGGDAIDLDPADGPFLTTLITLQWSSPADDATVQKIASDFISRLDKASKAAGLYYPFQYMNDAMRGQEIFKLYGGGKSLPKLRSIQKRYDQDGILTKYENSGFKL